MKRVVGKLELSQKFLQKLKMYEMSMKASIDYRNNMPTIENPSKRGRKFYVLPDELIVELLCLLPIRDVFSFSATCTRYRWIFLHSEYLINFHQNHFSRPIQKKLAEVIATMRPAFECLQTLPKVGPEDGKTGFYRRVFRECWMRDVWRIKELDRRPPHAKELDKGFIEKISYLEFVKEMRRQSKFNYGHEKHSEVQFECMLRVYVCGIFLFCREYFKACPKINQYVGTQKVITKWIDLRMKNLGGKRIVINDPVLEFNDERRATFRKISELMREKGIEPNFWSRAGPRKNVERVRLMSL